MTYDGKDSSPADGSERCRAEADRRHGRLPWENAGPYDFDKDVWELYDVEHDFSEANDLAKSQPQKLKELEDLFWAGAAKYNVLPLDDRFIERADPSLRPSLIAGRTAFTYFPGAYRIPESSSPNVKNKVAQHHGLHRHALEGW